MPELRTVLIIAALVFFLANSRRATKAARDDRWAKAAYHGTESLCWLVLLAWMDLSG